MRACIALLFFLFCLCEAETDIHFELSIDHHENQGTANKNTVSISVAEADIHIELSIDHHENQGTANKNTECKNATKEVGASKEVGGSEEVGGTVKPGGSVACSDGSDGFTLDGGVCYYISTEKRTWNESRQFCRGKQSDLIIINSNEKQDLLTRRTDVKSYVWIGLSHNDVQGIWKWVDGTVLTTPTYWTAGEPNHNDEDCAGFYKAAADDSYPRGWYDSRCSDSLIWMCERVV